MNILGQVAHFPHDLCNPAFSLDRRSLCIARRDPILAG